MVFFNAELLSFSTKNYNFGQKYEFSSILKVIPDKNLNYLLCGMINAAS